MEELSDVQCLALDAANDSIACCHMAVVPSHAQSDDEDEDDEDNLDFFPSDDLACSYPQVMKTDHVEMPPDYYPTGIPYDMDLDALHFADDETVDSIPTISESLDPTAAENTPVANV